MHLTTKQIAILLVPFLISGVIYFFDMDIVKNVHYLFPNYKEYTNKTLDKKAVIYLKIESKDKLYQEIQSDILARRENAKWVAERVLYKKMPPKPKNLYIREKDHFSSKIEKKKANLNNLKLQAVFSKDKVAIINEHFVKESSSLGGVKILKIEQNRVLLGYKKGKKWIYLFQ